jgi:hypothetical protein
MAQYLWRRQYAEATSESLRLAGANFRTTFIVAHISLVVWLVLLVFQAATHPGARNEAFRKAAAADWPIRVMTRYSNSFDPVV